MKIFVTGGTGFVGGHVRRALLERGHSLRLLVHRRSEGVEAGVEQVEGDVTRQDTFAGAMAGCDVIVNLVGIIREFPAQGITFEKLHVEATRNLVEAARAAGIRRHLQMSALATRPDATAAYHRTKWRAEEVVRQSELDWTIFRPSLIFGPKGAFVDMLAGFVRRFPAVPVVGDGTYRLQPVSVDDVARCFALALDMPETVGQTYELCGPDRLTYNEVLDTIGRVLGKGHVVKIPQPLGLLKLVVPIMQGFSFFPLTMDQIILLTEENICSNAWPSVFGFEPCRFEAGIASFLHR
ncbi:MULTISPECIES: NAD-dependent epimerase/dehydratase family protein [Geobacter]|uniref:NAD-dependent epimerase/dehydratase family protein n=1 Tax=Geobacter TaxID=28231 RepID=UPI0025740590|nr:NAD-dependent epimerase/dehydratase family protein [Geobacter sulfurreducens]BEH08725.1 NAD(P)H-binding protein [Geobacter sulfurreducens subsp. ethanolicus]BET60212.1 NAD(P)H-binding protein [Geobacter sp. 60473]